MDKMLIVVCCLAICPMMSHAITFNGKRLANDAKFTNSANSYASARSSSTTSSSTYEIVVNRTKKDKGDLKIFALTYAFVTVANGGSRSEKLYTWIPSSGREFTIGQEVGKFVIRYTTPDMKFDKEKWEYIGDYSKGAKLNGVLVCLCDMATEDNVILKVFKTCAGKIPKNGKAIKEIIEDSVLNKKIEDLEFFDMDTCKLAPVP